MQGLLSQLVQLLLDEEGLEDTEEGDFSGVASDPEESSLLALSFRSSLRSSFGGARGLRSAGQLAPLSEDEREDLRSTLQSTLGSSVGSWPATSLRGLRRTGLLATLDTAGYATLMGGTLFRFHEDGFVAPLPQPLLDLPPSAERLEPETDLASTLQMLQTAALEGGEESSAPSSPAQRSPQHVAAPRSSQAAPSSPSGGGSSSAHEITGASSPNEDLGFSTAGTQGGWWRTTGQFAAAERRGLQATEGGTPLSTQSHFSIDGEAFGGDGMSTFNMHGILRRLVSEGGAAGLSLADQAQRMMQLGQAANGECLSEAEIEALPKVRFESVEQQSCAICLEAYRRQELLTALSCQHFFHVTCLARWFQRSARCPLCRSSQRDP